MSSNITIKILLLLITILGLMVGAVGCLQFSAQSTPTEESQPAQDFTPVVSATGVIVPAQWSMLSMSAPGVVVEMLVGEGDRVETGQVLMRLKGTEGLQAAITAARMELVAAEQALKDLQENAAFARANAMEQIAIANKRLRDAKYSLDNFTIPGNQANLTAIEAVALMKERLDKARQAFEPYKYESENNDTRRDLKKKLDAAQSDYNAAVRRLEYEVELATAEAAVDKAMQDYEAVKEGPDPDEVSIAAARLENARTALAAAEAALADLELRAPFDGTVSKLYIRLGEWVAPGQPIMLLADLGKLRIETTDLNEIDVARIRVGNPARITFDAFTEVEVTGRVVSIALKSSEGAGVNFTVSIEMDQVMPELRWGMTSFVDIEVE